MSRKSGDVCNFEHIPCCWVWDNMVTIRYQGGEAMSIPSKHQILLVDDEPSVRESLTMLLTAVVYGVTTAANGFDGLLQLKRATPDVIISDLNMPEMSGFEFLSVVRRRFPQIPVVAISGAYDRGSEVPGGVIADAFYPKGRHHPKELVEIVADLVRTSVERSNAHKRESAPVWIPRNGKDSHGIPFVVLTCTDCLRSFPP
jgi:CheY-like chemotaxis protein